jgi:hypothetical protein
MPSVRDRDPVRAQPQLGVGLDELDRHHDGDAEPDERADHPVQRLPEVVPERRGQGEFEARERIDRHALGADRVHRESELLHRLIHREVELLRPVTVLDRRHPRWLPGARSRRTARGRDRLDPWRRPAKRLYSIGAVRLRRSRWEMFRARLEERSRRVDSGNRPEQVHMRPNTVFLYRWGGAFLVGRMVMRSTAELVRRTRGEPERGRVATGRERW